MKRICLLLTLGTLFLTPAAFAQQSGSTNNAPPGGPPHGGHMGGGFGMLTQDERDELRKAHDAALQNDQSLAQEGKDLQEKMKAYQDKVNAAMIKADPKVAPIIAKLEKEHKHHGPGGSPEGDQPPPPPEN